MTPAPRPASGPAVLAAGDNPTVTVVVVTYNSGRHIDDCLRAITGQLPNKDSGVVVFDNASSDDTTAIVEQRWPEVRLVRSPDNLGFGRACNRAADGLATRYVLFVNPDAILRAGCVDALLDVARRCPEGGLYGGRSYSTDGALDPHSCFGRPTLWGLWCFATGLSTAFTRSQWLNPEGLGAWARDSERPVGVISGCLLLADRELWDRLGGFDPEFFMYGEDVDLSVRAAGLRYAPMITPAAGVVHVGGASSSPVNMHIMLFRGKVSLARKLWSGPRRRLALALLLLGVLVRARLSAVVQRARAGGRGHRTSPGVWEALWRRRAEWRGGWAADQA
jgi:N-acetylglucosaminyl-diphospho-decaprenol L-rhamnosyltransferase